MRRSSDGNRLLLLWLRTLGLLLGRQRQDAHDELVAVAAAALASDIAVAGRGHRVLKDEVSLTFGRERTGNGARQERGRRRRKSMRHLLRLSPLLLMHGTAADVVLG